MPRLFVGNFSFEQQLIEKQRVNLPRHLLSLNADYATIWLSVAEPGDVIFAPHAKTQDLELVKDQLGLEGIGFITSLGLLKNPGDYQLIPWGWNQEMAEIASSVLRQQLIPDLDIVKQVNSRQMSFQLEHDLDCAHVEIMEFTELEQLQLQVQRLLVGYNQVVLKAEFGMSGRERIICTQPMLTVQQFHWIRHRLEQGQRIYLEPWLDKVFEISTHFLIQDEHSPSYLATTPLLTNRRGEHRGNIAGWNILDADHHLIAKINSIVREAAATLGDLGYKGPLSIDSMVYKEGTQLRIRPLQDINARWSMGRIAVEFHKRFAASENTLWHHFRLDQPVIESAILEQELQDLHKNVMMKSAKCSIKNKLSTSPKSFGKETVRFQTELISFQKQ